MLNLASNIHSPDHSTIGTRSPFDGLSVLVSTRFQVLFHLPGASPFPHCNFSNGHRLVFRLEDCPLSLPPGFSCPAVLWTQIATQFFAHETHLLGLPSHTISCLNSLCTHFCPNPESITISVWLSKCLLATTSGILLIFPRLTEMFPVQAVPIYLFIQYMMTRHDSSRIAPSEIYGSNAYYLVHVMQLVASFFALWMPRHSLVLFCSLIHVIIFWFCFMLIVANLQILIPHLLLIQRITFNHIGLSAILYSVFVAQSVLFSTFICRVARLVGL